MQSTNAMRLPYQKRKGLPPAAPKIFKRFLPKVF
jgi:hypothetical protein